MKVVLNAFGLSWAQMDQMQVGVEGDDLIFTYENKSFAIRFE